MPRYDSVDSYRYNGAVVTLVMIEVEDLKFQCVLSVLIYREKLSHCRSKYLPTFALEDSSNVSWKDEVTRQNFGVRLGMIKWRLLLVCYALEI